MSSAVLVIFYRLLTNFVAVIAGYRKIVATVDRFGCLQPLQKC